MSTGGVARQRAVGPRLTNSSPVRPMPRCRKQPLPSPAAEVSHHLSRQAPCSPESQQRELGPGFAASAQPVSRAHRGRVQQHAPVLGGGSGVWCEHSAFVCRLSTRPCSCGKGRSKSARPWLRRRGARSSGRCSSGRFPTLLRLCRPGRGPSTCGCQHLDPGDSGLCPAQALSAFCVSAAGRSPHPPAGFFLSSSPQLLWPRGPHGGCCLS